MDSIQLSQPAVDNTAAVQVAQAQTTESSKTTGFSQIFVDQKNAKPPKAELASAEDKQPVTAKPEQSQSEQFEAHEVSDLDSTVSSEEQPPSNLDTEEDSNTFSVAELIADEESKEIFVQPPIATNIDKTKPEPVTAEVKQTPANPVSPTLAQGIAGLPTGDLSGSESSSMASGEKVAVLPGIHQLGQVPAAQPQQIDLAAMAAPTKIEATNGPLQGTTVVGEKAATDQAKTPVARGIDLLAQQLGNGAGKIPAEEATTSATPQPVANVTELTNATKKIATPTGEVVAVAKEVAQEMQADKAKQQENALKAQAETELKAVAAGKKSDKKAAQTDLASLSTTSEAKPGAVALEPLYPRRTTDGSTFDGIASVSRATSSFSANSAASTTGLSTAPHSLNIRDKGWETSFSQNIQWMANKDIKSAQIRISPAELGPIQIELSMNKDQLTLQMNAHHAITRDTLEAAIPRLRSELGNSGFSQVNIDLGNQGGAQQKGANESGSNGGEASASESPGMAPGDDIETPNEVKPPQLTGNSYQLLDLFA